MDPSTSYGPDPPDDMKGGEPKEESPPEEEGEKADSDSLQAMDPSTSYGPDPPDDMKGGEPKEEIPLEEEVLEFPGEECRMVLIGKTGNGKSATGNTIVGTKRFVVGLGVKSKTRRCQWHNCTRFGINIEVVDTPGIFDSNEDDDIVLKEVMRCVGMVSPGPHALLLVVRLDVRFTDEEANSVQEVKTLFGDDIMRHTIIVFTHGDCLAEHENPSAEEALQEVLEEAPPALYDILKVVDRRYVVFNNTASPDVKKEQVRQLMLTIRGMLSFTDNKHLTSPFLEHCEQAVMTRASELGKLLDTEITSDRCRAFIRAGLESRERLEEVLHQVMDRQMDSEKELQELKHTLSASEFLQKDLEREIFCKINELKEMNERLRKKDQDLEHKDKLLLAKDYDLRHKDEQLRRKDEVLLRKKEELCQKEEALRKKDDELRKTKEELDKKKRPLCDIL